MHSAAFYNRAGWQAKTAPKWTDPQVKMKMKARLKTLLFLTSFVPGSEGVIGGQRGKDCLLTWANVLKSC